MERMTVPDKRIDEHTTMRTVIDANKVREHAMDFYWALKRYEDTGLEPSEVEQIQRAAEYMMFESVGDFVRYAIANFEELQQYHSISTIDRLRELAQADRDGRCVVLPCKVGDAAYVIDAGDYQSDYKPYVREKEVTEISWKKVKNGKDLGFGVILKGGDCNTSARYKIQNIGKTVFLTREEAEVALEEMKNG